jgi:hypothetical protein
MIAFLRDVIADLEREQPAEVAPKQGNGRAAAKPVRRPRMPRPAARVSPRPHA